MFILIQRPNIRRYMCVFNVRPQGASLMFVFKSASILNSTCIEYRVIVGLERAQLWNHWFTENSRKRLFIRVRLKYGSLYGNSWIFYYSKKGTKRFSIQVSLYFDKYNHKLVRYKDYNRRNRRKFIKGWADMLDYHQQL